MKIKRLLSQALCLTLASSLIYMGTQPLTSKASASTSTYINTNATRPDAENLGRGVVAVRTGTNIFVSWRFLASDSETTSFNLYRLTDGADAVLLNDSPIATCTNYTDKTADVTKENTYYVTSINDGIESEPSTSYTIATDTINGPVVTIPIKDGSAIKNIWTGDFNGDGEYDFLVDRYSETQQLLEAYLNDGTYLWTVNLGPNSENKYRISPGSSTIDVGHWDGATVYDIDQDGQAEVLLKIANGVTFGDGVTFTYENDVNQWVAVLDGMTGSCDTKAAIPDDYISIGSLAAQFGIGYLDGEKPSLVTILKNRNPSKSFNMIIAAYSYTDGKFQMDWKWRRADEGVTCEDGHQIRIADVDCDGKDEILEIGFCLNGDGTLRYTLSTQGILHGDRFYVTKFNKDDSVMMGYGIQQDNSSGLLEYYYNASTGQVIWEHSQDEVVDVGRGCFGDLDPTADGLEVWSFSGIYNAKSNTLLSDAGKTLWPSYSLFWDGDLLSESYSTKNVIEKWDYSLKSVKRVLTCYKVCTAVCDGNFVIHYGDILGDWREEVVCTNGDHNQIVIYTTNTPTDYRITTLSQDPCYRNSMTIKGYKETHNLSFYLGADMFN